MCCFLIFILISDKWKIIFVFDIEISKEKRDKRAFFRATRIYVHTIPHNSFSKAPSVTNPFALLFGSVYYSLYIFRHSKTILRESRKIIKKRFFFALSHSCFFFLFLKTIKPICNSFTIFKTSTEYCVTELLTLSRRKAPFYGLFSSRSFLESSQLAERPRSRVSSKRGNNNFIS